MHRNDGTRRRRAAVAAVGAVAVAVLAVGCSQGGSGLSGAAGGDAAGGDAAVSEQSGRASDAGAVGEPGRAAVQARAVIRRGEVVLRAGDLGRARAAVDDVLGRLGGHLASEDTTNDRRGRPARSVLELRVPEPAFDDAMASLADIGRTVRTDRSAEDVTTEVIDVDSRVATHRASLGRLQRFLRQAGTVEDMIRLESEIAERQAELESLEAQQDYLRDQTSLSTITVRMSAAVAVPAPRDGDDGFLAGLAAGWAALKTVVVGAATVVGAVVPFASTLALLVVPLWLVVRAVRRRRVPAPPPAAPDPT